ncbi:hypothetical protein EYF80_058630 [Liparis tanakae]|uniref:Uncharacterized protein n=1 Tax=Liparis tanakae TaxID=230148 RepID=A0A4Z2EQJ5_9TELE|nr:hypothetical protein EYF80_058630 [Liparis tanakae]
MEEEGGKMEEEAAKNGRGERGGSIIMINRSSGSTSPPVNTGPRRSGMEACPQRSSGGVSTALLWRRGHSAPLAAWPVAPAPLVLTDADRQLSGPGVVLLADPHGGADEPEAGAALVDHPSGGENSAACDARARNRINVSYDGRSERPT